LNRFVDRAITTRDNHIAASVASRARSDLCGLAWSTREAQINRNAQ
jgi:hypothetical protein